MTRSTSQTHNVINYPYIDYIIKAYVPELQMDEAKYRNVNMSYFREAVTHFSVGRGEKTYERLEYLGDAIFHMIITEYFYRRYDDETEGFLTRLRIRTERGDSMAELSKILELDQQIRLNKTGLNDHILEDVFEAFLGAFYLNFRMKYTRQFIIKLIEKHKNISAMIYYDDNYKDLLLRYFHQMKWGHPKYQEKKLPNNKYMSILKDPTSPNKIIAKGTSSVKRKADQLASKNALIHYKVIVDGEIDYNWLDKIDKVESEEKARDKTDKKPLPIFNPNNKLFTKSLINRLLLKYGVIIPKETSISLKIFNEAMTHRSYLVRKKLTKIDNVAAKNTVRLQKKSNERLKFLGDAVIHFVIGEYLFLRYENYDEGSLTRLRCKLENRDMLYYFSTQTGIGSYVLISQNIEVLHGRTNINIIKGGFEGFMGALYLEVGLELVRRFIVAVIETEIKIDKIATQITNYKEIIMQYFNKNKLGYPTYKVIKEEGPDHLKVFTIGLYYNDKLYGRGKATSKPKAEQIAAKQMYDLFLKDKIVLQ